MSISNRMIMFGGAIAIAAGALGFGAATLMNPPKPASASANDGAASESPAPSREIEVSAERVQSAGIVVERVTPGNFNAEVLAPATASSAATGHAIVAAHASGTVARITKRLGEPVKAGEALAFVESREASAIAADRAVAQARVEQARKAAEREQKLFDQRVSPRQDLEAAQAELAVAEAEALRAGNAATAAKVSKDGRFVVVASPIVGRITAMTATLGSFVEPETELFRIADPRVTQAEAVVTAADAGRIAPGDPGVIVTPGGAELPVSVASITPSLDPKTRTATVILALTQNAGALVPGQALRVRISPNAASKEGFVIPEDSVQSVNGRDVVFVRTEKGFSARPVVVGARSGGRASVLSGLNEGESVATQNAFLLKAELTQAAEE